MAFVQSAHGFATTPVNTLSVTYTNNVNTGNSGNLLICATQVSIANSPALTSISDSTGNTWNQFCNPYTDSTNTNTKYQLFYTIAGSTGHCVVTTNWSATGYVEMIVAEYTLISGPDVPIVTGAPQSGTGKSTVNYGDSSIESSTFSGNTNIIEGFPVTTTGSLQIGSISVYINTAVGNIVAGIYDSTGTSGNPGNLLASTASTALTGTGWWTLPTTTTPTLSAAKYYIAISVSGAAGFNYKVGTSATTVFKAFTYTGSMPATFPTTPSTSTSIYSLYASFPNQFVDSGVVTTTNANDLLIGYCGGTSATPTSLGPGWTQRDALTNSVLGTSAVLLDKTVSTTGSYNLTLVQPTGSWVGMVWALKAAPSAILNAVVIARGKATETPRANVIHDATLFI